MVKHLTHRIAQIQNALKLAHEDAQDGARENAAAHLEIARLRLVTLMDELKGERS